jgi:hypothetical protein
MGMLLFIAVALASAVLETGNNGVETNASMAAIFHSTMLLSLVWQCSPLLLRVFI